MSSVFICRIRNAPSATKPCPQPPGKLVPVPIPHQHPGQLKRVSTTPDHRGKVGASAGKASLPHESDSLWRVIGPRAIRIGKAAHRATEDLLQTCFAPYDLSLLCSRWESREHRVCQCVGTNFDHSPFRELRCLCKCQSAVG